MGGKKCALMCVCFGVGIFRQRVYLTFGFPNICSENGAAVILCAPPLRSSRSVILLVALFGCGPGQLILHWQKARQGYLTEVAVALPFFFFL